MSTVTIRIKKLRPTECKVPAYYSEHAAAMDLFAATKDLIWLDPGQNFKVPTGIAIEIPPGYEGQIRPRSSIAWQNIIIPNSPGTIDADYRGEIYVPIRNIGTVTYLIEPLERIAQLVISPVVKVVIQESDYLSSTVRGTGGFGSTGRK